MILKGHHSSFELNLLDYEYDPEEPLDADRNRLLISLRTRWLRHQTTLTIPILLTWEVNLLVKWMRFIARTGHPLPPLSFTEPCLTFQCLSVGTGDLLLQIKLDCEASPYWHTDLSSSFWLPVTPSRDELLKAATSLEEQFCRFPVRV